MKKHQNEYRQLLAEIGSEAFKRPLFTHRNAITTGWKMVGKVSRDNTEARESILEGGPSDECQLKLAKLFLLQQGIQGEESTEPDEKIARAKGMDAGLRTAGCVGRDRNQFGR